MGDVKWSAYNMQCALGDETHYHITGLGPHTRCKFLQFFVLVQFANMNSCLSTKNIHHESVGYHLSVDNRMANLRKKEWNIFRKASSRINEINIV